MLVQEKLSVIINFYNSETLLLLISDILEINGGIYMVNKSNQIILKFQILCIVITLKICSNKRRSYGA